MVTSPTVCAVYAHRPYQTSSVYSSVSLCSPAQGTVPFSPSASRMPLLRVPDGGTVPRTRLGAPPLSPPPQGARSVGGTGWTNRAAIGAVRATTAQSLSTGRAACARVTEKSNGWNRSLAGLAAYHLAGCVPSPPPRV